MNGQTRERIMTTKKSNRTIETFTEDYFREIGIASPEDEMSEEWAIDEQDDSLLAGSPVMSTKSSKKRQKGSSSLIDLPTITDGNDGVGSQVIDLYLSEMRKQRLLTHAEEIQLAKAIEAGVNAAKKLEQISLDEKEINRLNRLVAQAHAARERLIRCNMRLVISIAKKYRNRGLNFLDLIQEGNVGLIIATDKYDYTMGNRFSTYATWWIRQAITRALANHSRTIRLPAHWHSLLIKANQFKRSWEQTYQRTPTLEELASHLELSLEQTQWLLNANYSPVSLEQPFGMEDDTELGDFIEDSESPDPVAITAQNMLTVELGGLLDQLPAREARILRLRYGLYDGEYRTFREVGEIFGLSRERIRQLEHDALRKLRLFPT